MRTIEKLFWLYLTLKLTLIVFLLLEDCVR